MNGERGRQMIGRGEEEEEEEEEEGEERGEVGVKIEEKGVFDGGKCPSQQIGALPIPQIPIRLTNIWYRRLNEIMDPLLF